MTTSRSRRPMRKYPSYNALDKRLRADGIPSPGKVASLLLETFLENKGSLFAHQVVEKGLCGDGSGEFTKWRRTLEKAGWLIYDNQYAKACKNNAKHKPGPQLVDYINVHKWKNSEIATIDDVNSAVGHSESLLKSDIHSLHAKYDEMRAELDKISGQIKVYIQAFRRLFEPFLGENAPDEEIALLLTDVVSGKFNIFPREGVETECEALVIPSSTEKDSNGKQKLEGGYMSDGSTKSLFLV